MDGSLSRFHLGIALFLFLPCWVLRSGSCNVIREMGVDAGVAWRTEWSHSNSGLCCKRVWTR
eukprot:scaffold214811_cov63-Attheya_sp.AAC.2